MSDLISRQAAISTFLVKLTERERKSLRHMWTTVEVKYYIAKILEQLPSAQPQRKKGKWIKISPANIYECSECGKNVMTDDISAYDFCHGCGADMRGESDD